MKRSPRHVLSHDFVRAVRASGHGIVALAALASFPSFTQISKLMHARSVAASPLTIERLRALARVVNYEGPIFKGGVQ